jgi:hypothetical protein
MKRMMNQFLIGGALCASIGAGSLHAFKHVIHRKVNPAVNVGSPQIYVEYEGGCVPAGMEISSDGKSIIHNLRLGQSLTLDSGNCRLAAINGKAVIIVQEPCSDQNFDEHLCMKGKGPLYYTYALRPYTAPRGGDGDAEYEVIESGIVSSSGINKVK